MLRADEPVLQSFWYIVAVRDGDGVNFSIVRLDFPLDRSFVHRVYLCSSESLDSHLDFLQFTHKILFVWRHARRSAVVDPEGPPVRVEVCVPWFTVRSRARVFLHRLRTLARQVSILVELVR